MKLIGLFFVVLRKCLKFHLLFYDYILRLIQHQSWSLVIGAKKIFLEYKGVNISEIKTNVQDYCYKILNDGTSYFIDEVFNSEDTIEEKKVEFAKRFASVFHKAFDFSNDKPKLNKDFRFRLAEIYREKKNLNPSYAKAVFNLYNYYSKYDHLSHWTSLASQIPFENRKGKLDLSITLIIFHLRDLLAIAYDMNEEYKVLFPYMTELQEHLEKNYNNEQPENIDE